MNISEGTWLQAYYVRVQLLFQNFKHPHASEFPFRRIVRGCVASPC